MCASTLRPLPTHSHGRALRLLLQAFDEAAAEQQPASESAIELPDFGAARGVRVALRWLVRQGYAEHLIEVTPRNTGQRRFRPARGLAFEPRSCFVLTAAGIELGRHQVTVHRAKTPQQVERPSQQAELEVPRWDGEARKLWLRDILVKSFPGPAPNQQRILAALEEEGWPPHIDDPLPPQAGSDSKRRLHDAIYKLNKHQQHALIHFHGDGTGQGVCWERREPS